MFAPALTWGLAMPAASNATDQNLYDAALPSLPESAVLGAMFAAHRRGLQSGGIVGYSTFFTGYNEATASPMRRLSIGRLAAQGVSAAARGLMLTPLSRLQAVEPYLAAASEFSRLGVGAFMGIDAATYARVWDEVGAELTRPVDARRLLGPAAGGTGGTGAQLATPRRSPMFIVDRAGASTTIRGGQTGLFDDFIARTPYARSAVAQRLVGESAGWKWLMGVLGGMGFGDDGEVMADIVYSERTGRYHAVARSGSKGATVLEGTAGRLIGRGLKFAGALEVAAMAASAAADIAGGTYAALVRTTDAMNERLGLRASMSPAYFTQAAVTERQRAVMELNQSVLAPRTQIMGSEAALYHR